MKNAGTTNVHFTATGDEAEGHPTSTQAVSNGHMLYAFQSDGAVHEALGFAVAMPKPGHDPWADFFGCTLSPI